jgi:hypothetical protein
VISDVLAHSRRDEWVVGVLDDQGWHALKSNKNRTVVVPAFVMTALSATAAGKGREDLLWTAPHGGYLRAPGRGVLARRRSGALPGCR